MKYNQLTELRGIALLLDGTGTLATGQITIFTGGRAEVTATTPDFNNMSTVDGSSFIVKGGGKVFLPKITSYAGDGEESDFFTTMEVEGAGSVLDLSKVATLAGNTFVNDSLVVKAASGGQINLSSVTQITQGKVQFTAENSGSLIDLSALTNFARSGRGDSFMQVADNGKIDMKTNTVTMGDVHLILEENGSYTAGTFQLDGESALRGKGALPINIINNGSVAPGNNVGQLQINGTYAQSITGTLTIQINGKTVGTEFDQLQVTGNATLNGALTLDLGNNYSPAIGDSFVIELTQGFEKGWVWV